MNHFPFLLNDTNLAFHFMVRVTRGSGSKPALPTNKLNTLFGNFSSSGFIFASYTILF